MKKRIKSLRHKPQQAVCCAECGYIVNLGHRGHCNGIEVLCADCSDTGEIEILSTPF